MEDGILKQIQEYLDNTPLEVLQKEWKEKEYLDDMNPMFDDVK